MQLIIAGPMKPWALARSSLLSSRSSLVSWLVWSRKARGVIRRRLSGSPIRSLRVTPVIIQRDLLNSERRWVI